MRPLLSAVAVAALVSPAAAQDVRPSPLAHGDAQVVVGWQNLREKQPPGTLSHNDWLSSIVHGAAGAGWYWTDHLKTEIDFGGGTSGRQYRYGQVTAGGTTTYSESLLRIRETNIGVSQQYQFFRNEWFHPHVGLGVDIARQHSTEQYYPVTIVDSVTHVSRTVVDQRLETETRTLVRPFGELGFKAYMTRRAFFTGDTRLRFRGGIDEVRFRFGFGVDF
jgi:opacity protein-like surface antigen